MNVCKNNQRDNLTETFASRVLSCKLSFVILRSGDEFQFWDVEDGGFIRSRRTVVGLEHLSERLLLECLRLSHPV